MHIIKNIKQNEIEQIQSVEKSEYDPINWAVPNKVFETRFNNCFYKKPGDLFWVAKEENKITGYITGLIIDFDEKNHPKSREEAIGYDEESYGVGLKHNPSGNALYIMSIGVSNKGKGIATDLVKETQKFVLENNLEFRVAGLRSWYNTYLNGNKNSIYSEYRNSHDNISPEEYQFLKREDGQPIDPLMRLYSRLGFKPLKLIENYAPEDVIGNGYGQLMVWKPKEV
jgi:hypothetical protein